MQLRRKALTLLVVLLAATLSAPAVQMDRLRAHVTWLADPAREGRRAGQPGAVEAAQYISAEFFQLGFDVQMQDFGFGRRNVVARHGDAEKYIVVGAHYDGQGKGMPSASDNAAGVAVLLDLARDLKGARLPASLVMIAFDDEEQGLVGSRHYVDNSPWPLENALAVIIFDTMGRSFLDLQSATLFVLGTEYSDELSTVVAKRSRQDMLVAGTDLVGPRSDFAPFALKRIPYLFFTHATHQDYHGPGDTADKINYRRLTQDAALIGEIIRDIARLKSKPVYRAEPLYPSSEVDTILRLFQSVKSEKKDLPPAYQLIFEDMAKKLRAEKSRPTMQLAAASLLALATPRLSPFMLDFMLAPYYQSQNRTDVVAAIKEESARWDK